MVFSSPEKYLFSFLKKLIVDVAYLSVDVLKPSSELLSLQAKLFSRSKLEIGCQEGSNFLIGESFGAKFGGKLLLKLPRYQFLSNGLGQAGGYYVGAGS